MKLAQLSGYVAEQTAYHHGEASLHAAIIHMAQSFPGSNNVSLLYPSGQFGTRYRCHFTFWVSRVSLNLMVMVRLQGGKDAASPRYIFTRLDPVARMLFREEDDHLLSYADEDGEKVQPHFYMPILPTILVNGCEGLGTRAISFTTSR